MSIVSELKHIEFALRVSSDTRHDMVDVFSAVAASSFQCDDNTFHNGLFKFMLLALSLENLETSE